jgi:hypothetical protein
VTKHITSKGKMPLKAHSHSNDFYQTCLLNKLTRKSPDIEFHSDRSRNIEFGRRSLFTPLHDVLASENFQENQAYSTIFCEEFHEILANRRVTDIRSKTERQADRRTEGWK